MKILRITADQTHPLRHAILRPNQPLEACTYPGDDAPDTAHFGAIVDNRIIGITSVYRELPPGQNDPGAWRLRGMAVDESLRRRGHGKALLEASIAHVRLRGGTGLWFNARNTAVPFYEAFGFQVRGKQFELPGVGPHFFMSQEIGKL